MMYCDAHAHLAEIPAFEPPSAYLACACAHSPADFARLEQLNETIPFVRSFGVHPQNPDAALLPFLRTLLEQGRLDAIGEAGFDLYDDGFASRLDEQEIAWKTQLDAAAFFQKPLVVHCRKALDRIFRDSKALKKVPAVIFHSWPGSPQEGFSLLKRGINAFFSLGKPLLNGNKRAILSACQLPADRLLAETDAPYQTLKGERYTALTDITKVYAQLAFLREENEALLAERLEANFFTAFRLTAAARKNLRRPRSPAEKRAGLSG